MLIVKNYCVVFKWSVELSLGGEVLSYKLNHAKFDKVITRVRSSFKEYNPCSFPKQGR
jgi:hypothetical protein